MTAKSARGEECQGGRGGSGGGRQDTEGGSRSRYRQKPNGLLCVHTHTHVFTSGEEVECGKAL